MDFRLGSVVLRDAVDGAVGEGDDGTAFEEAGVAGAVLGEAAC